MSKIKCLTLILLASTSIDMNSQSKKDSVKINQLQEVMVDGKINRNNYLSSNRLQVKPIDMPNNTSFIGASLMKEQQILKPSEIFMNVAGVYQFNQGYGGTGETVGARGISLRYQGYMFRNGMRIGANQSGATPEIQSFESVEIHKGIGAINFGYTSIGATVNYVTKKPTFKNETSINMRVGQYGFYKPSVDVNVKVSEKLGIRVIGSYEHTGSFRETLKDKSKRMFGFLTAKYLINKKSYVSFDVDYLFDKAPRDFGIPIFETDVDTEKTRTVVVRGKSMDVPIKYQEKGEEKLWKGLSRTRFLGSPFNNRTTNQLNTNVNYFQEFNQNWNLIVNGGLSKTDNTMLQTGSGFYNEYKLLPNKDIEITRTFEKDKYSDLFGNVQINITGKIKITDNIENKISVSADFEKRNNKVYAYNNVANFDKILLSSSAGEKTKAPNQPTALIVSTDTYSTGFSLQNLISIHKKINLLFSLRYDKVNSNTPETKYLENLSSFFGPGNKKGEVKKGSDYKGTAWSPMLGLVYKLTEIASVYGSYTSGFEFNKRSYINEKEELLPGFRQNQFEVGVKQSWFDDKFNMNLAYYQIKTQSYVDVDGKRRFYKISPGTTYKGWELETSIHPILGLNINFNYTNIQAKYASGGSFKEGTRPQQTPEHQAGFYVSYKFLKGALKNLGLNFGGQYTGNRLGNDMYDRRYKTTTPYVQKPYTMLNLGMNYLWKQWLFNAKLANVSDVFVFNAYRYGSVNPMAPRTFSLGTTFNF